MYISLDKTGAIKIKRVVYLASVRCVSAGDDLRDPTVKGPTNERTHARPIWYISSISRSTCRDVRQSGMQQEAGSCYADAVQVDGTTSVAIAWLPGVVDDRSGSSACILGLVSRGGTPRVSERRPDHMNKIKVSQ